jgi:hypothetical protein
MKKLIAGLVLMLSAANSMAGYYVSTIANLYVGYDGFASVGFPTAPPGTCSSYSWQLRFDASSAGGKNMLAILMSAKLSGNSISIWYAESSNPGTNQSNGCSNGTMAVLQGVNVDQP